MNILFKLPIVTTIRLAIALFALNLTLSGISSANQANQMIKFTTNMGDISIEMYADKAPETVKNFINYVESGFFDGLIFHRVIPGFMIQG